MDFTVIIPARYESTRLPGKPLLLLDDKPIIQHVYECATQSNASQVIIATDDHRIKEASELFGASVCLTASTHQSGTERLAEVIEQLNIPADNIVVNLQGDEPLMPSACIDQVARAMTNSDAKVSTLCEEIKHGRDVFDPNVVKVVRNHQNYALYFSRAPIPWHRNSFNNKPDELPSDGTQYFRHIGLYAYRAGYIKEYISAQSAQCEVAESLEQLRVLWHGNKILVEEACEIPGPGIDTPEDFERVKSIFS